MKQVWITKAGGPEVLQVREAPDPEPRSGEVRIRTKYAGVNFADLMARMGIYPDAPPIPTVVGYEVAGQLDRVNDVNSPFKEGDRVVALSKFGGYSSAVCVPSKHVVKLPDSVDEKTAASIPVNYLTAWLMLNELGNVQKDQLVLVYSAAGGVGLAALQISGMRNARVIAVASESKHEMLRANGACECVGYRERSIDDTIERCSNGRGVDLILDSRGGASFKRSYKRLAPMGRLFLFGVSSFAGGYKRNIANLILGLARTPRFRPIDLMNENKGVIGCNLAHLWNEIDGLRPTFERIVDLVGDGTLNPVIDSVFKFEDAAKAHERLHNRKNIGKVLLEA